jgi:microcystin degradation protein MlrC
VTKVLLAGLYHETNTFAPEVTDVTQFTVRRGAELFDCAGDGSPIDGFLDIATREGWTVVPALSASAMPSGPVVDSVFESFWTELADVVNQSAGLDAIFLALHGAMVAQSTEDPEGEMLQRLRALPTAAQLPIFGVFDLHANVSPRMAASANGLVAYRENPHIDARLSACRVARLLARALRERRVPAWSAFRPILWPPSGTGTAIRRCRAGSAGAQIGSRRISGRSMSLRLCLRRRLRRRQLLTVTARKRRWKQLARWRLVATAKKYSKFCPFGGGPVWSAARHIGGGAPAPLFSIARRTRA